MPSQQQILSCEVILEKYGSSLAGKTILVTGVAADSIAGELAVQLSRANPALLILTARSQDRVEPIVTRIKATGLDVATRFLKMDLGILSSIREAVSSLKDIPTIDHVIAAAGVMLSPYAKTIDGIETHFAVNYVANFLLVKLLLPQVEAAGAASSIIVVASSEVRAGKVNFDDVNFNVRIYRFTNMRLLTRYRRMAIRTVPKMVTASPMPLGSCSQRGSLLGLVRGRFACTVWTREVSSTLTTHSTHATQAKIYTH